MCKAHIVPFLLLLCWLLLCCKFLFAGDAAAMMVAADAICMFVFIALYLLFSAFPPHTEVASGASNVCLEWLQIGCGSSRNCGDAGLNPNTELCGYSVHV